MEITCVKQKKITMGVAGSQLQSDGSPGWAPVVLAFEIETGVECTELWCVWVPSDFL